MKFTVIVGDISDNEAKVEVNGVPYKVELDRKDKIKKPVLSQSGHTNHGAPVSTGTKPAPKPALPGPATGYGTESPAACASTTEKI